ncbi:hypothetical protein D3C87_1860030 [compost metagenome]
MTSTCSPRSLKLPDKSLKVMFSTSRNGNANLPTFIIGSKLTKAPWVTLKVRFPCVEFGTNSPLLLIIPVTLALLVSLPRMLLGENDLMPKLLNDFKKLVIST